LQKHIVYWRSYCTSEKISWDNCCTCMH